MHAIWWLGEPSEHGMDQELQALVRRELFTAAAIDDAFVFDYTALLDPTAATCGVTSTSLAFRIVAVGANSLDRRAAGP